MLYEIIRSIRLKLPQFCIYVNELKFRFKKKIKTEVRQYLDV